MHTKGHKDFNHDTGLVADAAAGDKVAAPVAPSAIGTQQQQQLHLAAAVQQLRMQLLEVQGVVGQGFAVLCGKLRGMLEVKASNEVVQQVGGVWCGV
jgi:hypothetical protein